MDAIPDTYSTADVQAVERITAWLAAPGHTQSALARAAGCSNGTVSRILRGQWPSAPTAHLEGMLAALERADERREEPADIAFTETSVAAAIRSVARRAHNDRDFGLYCARVGVGKTRGLARYAAENRGAILVEAYPGAGAPVVLRGLVDAVGAAGRRRTLAEMTAAVVEGLRGADRVILVDEAETLTPQALLHLRRISDTAGVGVVLAGTPALLTLVYDPDGRFGQITSRIGFWPPVVQAITEDDAAALARSYLGEAPDAGTAAALWSECEGSARALRNLMRGARRWCRRHDCPLTADVVRRVSRHAMGGRRLAH